MVRSEGRAGRTILLVGPFQRMYYLGERILEWGSGPRARRVPMVPPLVFWTHELRGRELRRALRGTPAIRRTLDPREAAYQSFIGERLLPALPLDGLVSQVRVVSLLLYAPFTSSPLLTFAFDAGSSERTWSSDQISTFRRAPSSAG